MNEINKLIFSNIERYRKLRNIAKMLFYEKIGMSPNGYSDMVKNNSLKIVTLEKIAEVLNVKVVDLVKELPPLPGVVKDADVNHVLNDNGEDYGTDYKAKYLETLEKYTQLLEENKILLTEVGKRKNTG